MTKDIPFKDWLSNLMGSRGVSQADLSRSSGVDPATLSKILNGRKPPSLEVCKSLARALMVSLTEVYTAAGYMPKPETDTEIETVVNLMTELPTDEKQEILNYARFKYQTSLQKINPHSARVPRGNAAT